MDGIRDTQSRNKIEEGSLTLPKYTIYMKDRYEKIL